MSFSNFATDSLYFPPVDSATLHFVRFSTFLCTRNSTSSVSLALALVLALVLAPALALYFSPASLSYIWLHALDPASSCFAVYIDSALPRFNTTPCTALIALSLQLHCVEHSAVCSALIVVVSLFCW